MKTGKADAKALMAAGIGRVITLVRELAATGVASVAEGRARMLEGLAEGLRADRLRRLAGRVSRLAAVVSEVEDHGRLPISVEDYADLVSDLLLTARKLERHLGGEPLDDRHVEELIGKTWRKTDRAPVEGLDLVEYARAELETAEGFIVREARFVDAASGVHYADKQILPGFLARRTPPRPARAGQVLRGASGSVYPGYPPRRLDLADPGSIDPLDAATLDAIPALSIPAALTAFQDHRRDVFAPDFLPVTVRVDAVLAGERLLALDGTHALTLPADELLADQLAAALRDALPVALLGDLVLDRALPVLRPRAVILKRDDLRWLTPLTSPPTGLGPTGSPPTGLSEAGARSATAQSKASPASDQIAEIREQIAGLLAQGLASFTPRAAAPLAARLRELSLARPADIVDAIPAKPEPERLEDVVRIHQVLGVALVRLIGALTVDRDDLVAVPTHPGVLIARPARWLPLDATTELDRWTAAAHAAHALAEVPAETLLAHPHPWWAHASLSPLVAAAVAPLSGAIEQARAVLAPSARAGRAAQRTAIRVLCAADLDSAPRHVAQTLGRDGDRALGGFALDQIDAARERRGDAEAAAHRRDRRAIAADVTHILTQAGAAEDRARAAVALSECGTESAAAPLRVAFASDTVKVREAAAVALGRLCDPDAIDRFVASLRAQDDHARPSALALGESGDTRAIAALIEALIAGYRPALILDALRTAGAGALAALRIAAAAHPTVARRKGVRELLAA